MQSFASTRDIEALLFPGEFSVCYVASEHVEVVLPFVMRLLVSETETSLHDLNDSYNDNAGSSSSSSLIGDIVENDQLRFIVIHDEDGLTMVLSQKRLENLLDNIPSHPFYSTILSITASKYRAMELCMGI